MDKANEEVLRECAADYHNALKAFQKAKAELLLAEETVKANLSANKLYSTHHVHTEGLTYVRFRYDPDFSDSYDIKVEHLKVV